MLVHIQSTISTKLKSNIITGEGELIELLFYIEKKKGCPKHFVEDFWHSLSCVHVLRAYVYFKARCCCMYDTAVFYRLIFCEVQRSRTVINYSFTFRPQKCKICRRKELGSTLILCDDCNLAYHLQCLRPALSEVPQGHWSCPVCKVTLLSELLRVGTQYIVYTNTIGVPVYAYKSKGPVYGMSN